MANQRKALGTSLERTLVKVASRLGLTATRQPLSGALHDFPGDVVIEGMPNDGLIRLLVEAKVRSVHINAKGERILSIDLDWLSKVEAEAKRAEFSGAAVIVRPKNSPRLLCLVDAQFLLGLLQEGGRNGKAHKKVG